MKYVDLCVTPSASQWVYQMRGWQWVVVGVKTGPAYQLFGMWGQQ